MIERQRETAMNRGVEDKERGRDGQTDKESVRKEKQTGRERERG